MGWSGRSLCERLSARQPSIADLTVRCPVHVRDQIDGAVVIQSQTPYTYGDWVGQHLMTLTAHLPLPAPLILPSFLARKPYVRRDLELLGISLAEVRHPVRIARATVLPQHIPFHSFARTDVEAFRRGFGIAPLFPAAGFIVYLSRKGEASESSQRDYPHDLIAAVVSKLGGVVLETASARLEDYRNLASQADIVIADHGAALCNILHWRPRMVIELFSNSWWTHYFLFLSHASGIKRHCLLNIDAPDAVMLDRRIRGWVAEIDNQGK